MKQTAQKKPKVFRTLIRLIHIGGKPACDDSYVPPQRKRMKSSQDSLSSFSAGKHEYMR